MDGVIYLRLALTDSTSSSVAATLELAIEIIDGALNYNSTSRPGNDACGRAHASASSAGGRILVHCSAGVSRSPTIVVGYLMRQRDMSLRQALGYVVQRRPQVSPNSGFLRQLKEMEVELRGGVSTLDDVKELPRREVERLALFTDSTA